MHGRIHLAPLAGLMTDFGVRGKERSVTEGAEGSLVSVIDVRRSGFCHTWSVLWTGGASPGESIERASQQGGLCALQHWTYTDTVSASHVIAC